MAQCSSHGPARRVGRRSRHGAGHRRHAAAPRHRRIQVDPDCAGAGLDHRRPAGPGADDRRPAANRPQPRVRRALRRPWSARPNSICARPTFRTFKMAVLCAGSHSRLADLHRQPDGRGQAAGNSAAAAHYLSRAESRQPLAAGRCRGAGSDPGAASRAHDSVPADHRASP